MSGSRFLYSKGEQTGHWTTGTLPQLDTQNEAPVTDGIATFVNPMKVTLTTISVGRGEMQRARKTNTTKSPPNANMTLRLDIFGIVQAANHSASLFVLVNGEDFSIFRKSGVGSRFVTQLLTTSARQRSAIQWFGTSFVTAVCSHFG